MEKTQQLRSREYWVECMLMLRFSLAALLVFGDSGGGCNIFRCVPRQVIYVDREFPGIELGSYQQKAV